LKKDGTGLSGVKDNALRRRSETVNGAEGLDRACYRAGAEEKQEPLPMIKRYLCIVMAALAGWLGASRALALEKIEDGGPERAEFVRAVRQLFLDEEYELLDQMADKLWQEKTRFADGCWKLPFFYKAFRVEGRDSKVNWHEWWARYGRWEKKYPQSATARVMHAWTMMNYAWEARGGGWADTVSKEGWQLFAERIKIGRDILDSDPSLKKVPGYYEVMMTVALGQSWPREKAEDLFIEAAVLARDYEEFYFYRANFLQPKWYGKEGEWLRFADEAAEATKEAWGRAFYARVVWATLGLPDKNVSKMKRSTGPN